MTADDDRIDDADGGDESDSDLIGPWARVAGPAAVAEAAALGLPLLAQVLARSCDGVTIVDAERRWVYANPAASRMLGYPLAQLRGQELLSGIPAGEPAFALTHFADRPTGPATLSTGLLIGPDGAEREIAYYTFAIRGGDPEQTVAIFRDLTGPRSATRAAAALVQTAAQMTGSTTTNEILARIARHAFEGTRALSAGIAVMGDGHQLTFGGGYGATGPNFGDQSAAWQALTDAPGEDVIAAMSGGSIIVGTRPGKAVVLPDARPDWEANPLTRAFAESMRGDDWHGAICVPMAWQDKVIGLLGVYLPAGLIGPTEAELAFCTALADQAAVAVANARLSAQAAHAAALRERSRLARELHDSVSQALFSMTMHTRAAELALDKRGLDGAESLARSVAQLAELSRGTLAEMRALIFELRPEALAEEGLVGALRKQTAALSAREQVVITVRGPDQRLQLPAAVEEHLYRIASEALHNVVKHALAATAVVTVVADDGRITLTVSDDGVGFDPTGEHAGHLGLTTMTQRAEAIGAALAITSRPGTQVTVTLPADAVTRPAGG